MLLSEFKLTIKQKALLREIVKSHPYFPELALDDLSFNNDLYKPKDPAIQDMVEKDLIAKGKKKNLVLTRRSAKGLWDEILSTIPVDESNSPVSKSFLMTRDIEVLRKAFTTLTSKPAGDLDKETLIDEIFNSYNNKGEKMTDTTKKSAPKKSLAKEAPEKKAKQEPVNDGKLTPKQIASQHNMEPTEVRKALRAFYKGNKPEDGNWRIDPEDVEGILEQYKAKKAEAAKARSERMRAMIEAKKAKQAEVAKSTEKVNKATKKTIKKS